MDSATPVCDARPASGRLLVIGTPIGNLGDMSPRVATALSEAEAIYCEDTRVTSKLLAHIGIHRPLVRCDAHTLAARAPEVLGRVAAGQIVAYASDAGMPAISDPGQALVEAARAEGLVVEVVPGPSACITALVASGIACDHFFFEGFLPRKRVERLRRLEQLFSVPAALIFYESPHRFEAALEAVAEVFPGRDVALCRELTKLHEEVLRAPAPRLLEMIRGRGALKGEMVIVVAPPAPGEVGARSIVDAPSRDGDAIALQREIRAALAEGESVSRIAKRLSQRFSIRKRDVYDRVIAISGEEGQEPEVR
ncbi:Uroporphyrin-III C/tetrapyrrole (Corrin/Porphyrin) methyltransferase [Coriobacterium glomerans PW2]|uniref:Ribosomal RNA small subunit methyltransferase I n=1 Tax=Coriobacterium glomerans (strain ATCC 49209 / DSM 20642 / JCM 10262 / PW2) TaxID=700015 RepID=F2NA78_CORGP|nr:16S rRNA (cytidine(1402)-2'-O)-methyltransferase [Coriobacterium glomerans]AEB06472.1 Uroporphyrin-III C/tetrapyrrole (Corrin/Porphyrin) methyltransferase [Coriobacterium glomerans PW2]